MLEWRPGFHHRCSFYILLVKCWSLPASSRKVFKLAGCSFSNLCCFLTILLARCTIPYQEDQETVLCPVFTYFTFPAWMTLPGASLPPAKLFRSQKHTGLLTTSRWQSQKGQPLYSHNKMCSDNRTRTELNTSLLLTELFRFGLIPLKARHAEELGATAIGLIATSYFTPKTVGA